MSLICDQADKLATVGRLSWPGLARATGYRVSSLRRSDKVRRKIGYERYRRFKERKLIQDVQTASSKLVAAGVYPSQRKVYQLTRHKCVLPTVMRRLELAQKNYRESKKREILRRMRLIRRTLGAPIKTRSLYDYLAKQLDLSAHKIKYIFRQYAPELRPGQNRKIVIIDDEFLSKIEKALLLYADALHRR